MKCLPGTRYLAMAVVVLAIGACVTINIYFPAEKVESVAGEIVQDIRGETEEGEKAPKSDAQGALMQPATAVGVPIAGEVTEPPPFGVVDPDRVRPDITPHHVRVLAADEPGRASEARVGHVLPLRLPAFAEAASRRQVSLKGRGGSESIP